MIGMPALALALLAAAPAVATVGRSWEDGGAGVSRTVGAPWIVGACGGGGGTARLGTETAPVVPSERPKTDASAETSSAQLA
jgi:hypothetical protein